MRLIDADALPRRGVRYGFVHSRDIDKAPMIDAVPVVRCKNCKNWTEWENGAGSCQRSGSVMWLGTDATDFCSFGERKDDE